MKYAAILINNKYFHNYLYGYMCLGATKGTFRRIFICKKIRFYKDVQNFLNKFFCEFA